MSLEISFKKFVTKETHCKQSRLLHFSNFFLRLKNFQAQVLSTNLTKLESMIPKLNQVSDKLTKSLPLQQRYGDPKPNGKREIKLDEEDDDVAEVKPLANGYKKVKPNLSRSQSPDIILVGTAFSIKFICHADIQSFQPIEKQFRYGEWSQDGREAILIIKREDFVHLPSSVTLRLSKEHAKIAAYRNENYINYEITDLSVNGTYYLGNRIEGTIKDQPARLQKGIPFKLKHGDCICLLLKKDSKSPEALLGFEFLQS